MDQDKSSAFTPGGVTSRGRLHFFFVSLISYILKKKKKKKKKIHQMSLSPVKDHFTL
jgi:hypothetical protein